MAKLSDKQLFRSQFEKCGILCQFDEDTSIFGRFEIHTENIENSSVSLDEIFERNLGSILVLNDGQKVAKLHIAGFGSSRLYYKSILVSFITVRGEIMYSSVDSSNILVNAISRGQPSAKALKTHFQSHHSCGGKQYSL